MKGYEVVQVFTDEAVSGGLIDRPGIRAMLRFMRAKRKLTTSSLLLTTFCGWRAISRFTWNCVARLPMRAGVLENPSVEFGEDSDSILVENLLAAYRNTNGRRTSSRHAIGCAPVR
jgi:hypothetical protein